MQTTLSGSDPTAGPAHVRLTVMVHNDSAARTVTPTGTLTGTPK